MRPISLSLAGLQSYREVQTVDFTRLCDAGVFGIFGPTGSGKSTILDAMTLALYGSVVRAFKDTQGIMNQAEDTLSVSFTFELGNGEGIRRYSVERQYKRSGDVSVKNTVSRLVLLQQDGTPVVLADKNGEVNAQIQQILGLTMEDFTRAVVLPQGKFAEFLTLKGSERRQMLQRLFNLESYGDRLNAKVNARLKETEAGVRQIAAWQQGLGDASEQALASAEARLRQAAGLAAERRRLLDEGKIRYEERKRVREWQKEKHELESKLDQLKRREEIIRARERRLILGEQAERLLPYLEAWEGAKTEWSQSSAHLKSAEEELRQAARECEQAERLYEEARQSLASEEAPLVVRLERLKQARLIRDELARLMSLERELAKRRHEWHKLWEEASANLKSEETTREKALAKQAALKEQLRASEVSAAWKQRVQQAYADKQKLDHLRREWKEWNAQRITNETQLQALSEKCSQLEAERNRRLTRLQSWHQWLAEQDRAARQSAEAADRIYRLLSAAIGHIKEEAGKNEVRRLAAHLAKQLSPGEACPVCGSREHPLPARPGQEETVSAEQLDQAEALLRKAETAGLRAQQLQLLLDAAMRHIRLTVPEESAPFSVPEKGAPHEGVAGRVPEAAASLQTVSGLSHSAFSHETNIPAVLEEAEQVLREVSDWLESGLKSAAQSDRQVREETREVSELSARLRDLHSRHDALGKLVSSLADRETAARQACEALENEWRGKFPDLRPETVQDQWNALSELEEKAEQLRSRLEKSNAFIDDLLLRIQTVRQRLADLEKEQAGLAAQLAALADRIAEKRRELQNSVGEEDVDKLVREAEARLSALRRAEQERKQSRELASRKRQLAENRHSAARQAFALASEALKKKEKQWQEVLARSPFHGEQDVKAAYVAEPDKATWTAEVKEHREQERRLSDSLQRIEALLAGRSVSDEEWSAEEERYRALQEADELALKEKAKAERDLEELKSKHERWLELERQRLELEELRERLARLQSVLKANAFVEFIAEEQLLQVSRAASKRLGQLTRQRYALEVDSGGGFVIRDEANGGMRRPVSTLSGGETFLASLALSLALSEQIQLRGRYPLEFFFLDEGFGTLDPELLETVVTALERLHLDRLTVGVISHVAELRARLPRRLVVTPAEPAGRGSRISLESL
mgnify:CR=1 FL=1